MADITPDHPSYYLALDQGGQSTRIALFNEQGDKVIEASSICRTTSPEPSHIEHQPKEILSSVQICLDNIHDIIGNDIKYIKAAGFSTQRASFVCWDKNSGNALSPVISWQDCRAKQQLDELTLDENDIHKKTGLFASPHYGASKIQWCLNNLNNVKQAEINNTLIIGPLASFILFNFSKEHSLYVDASHASRTLLWNINTESWDEDLLVKFNVNRKLLPACHASRYLFGTLSHDNYQNHKIPITCMTGDQAASIFSQGQPQADIAYMNIGTGGFIQKVSLDNQLCKPPLISSLVFSDQQQLRTFECTINGAGSAISWLKQEHQLDISHDEINLLLQHESNKQNPMIFINGISGLGSPYWRSNFKSYFNHEGSINEKLVAIIESIVFLACINLTALHQQLKPSTLISISGGLSHIDGLCQRLANLSRIDVVRTQDTESTLRGIAFLTANNPSNWDIKAQQDFFRVKEDFHLEQRFELWQQEMERAL